MAINLAWTDNSSDEDKFLIERRTSGSVFQQIAVTAPNATGYTDSNVSPGTLYYYRVRALNENGYSTYISSSEDPTPSSVISARSSSIRSPTPPPSRARWKPTSTRSGRSSKE